jgi:hypothetical protein
MLVGHAFSFGLAVPSLCIVDRRAASSQAATVLALVLTPQAVRLRATATIKLTATAPTALRRAHESCSEAGSITEPVLRPGSR